MDLDAGACYRAVLARDARFDGRFFTAVTSTGIYCRPICPARPPKRENCLFVPSAAAAQNAGFRPCLRCRPEAAPELGAWLGTSNTVSRALALIEAGALDEGDVDTLAQRLGVGERQLRRLFGRHLGAAPVAVAQTRRVLLAKQLLHETSLPMADVALASGFGSVRRFNECFKVLFDRPPIELRRARDRHATPPPGSPIVLTLGYRPPYDWAALLRFLAARAIPAVERVEAGVYHRTIELEGAVGSVSLVQEPDRNRLCATIRFPTLAAIPSIVSRLRRMFDLAADPGVINEALSQDARLAPLVAARPGLRVPGAWDAFELAVRAIVGQQVTVASATKLMGRIAATHGSAHDLGVSGLSRVFPSAAVLAGAAIDGMPAARARSIAALSGTAMADHRLFERGHDLRGSVAKLRALPGIGDWTANYIAMRAMREPDAFPSGDVGLLRALAGAGARPSPDALAAASEAWRPWRAYAALHLWEAGTECGDGDMAHALAA